MDKVIGIVVANYDTPEMETLTGERTIASLPYCGRYRLIDFPLSNMVNSGIETVGLVLPYKYRSIIDHIGIGKEWSLDKKNGGLFILPGSAFGISSSSNRFVLRDFGRNSVYLHRSPAPYVVVTATNIICNIDYAKLAKAHIESGADITMVQTTARRDNKYLSTIVSENGRVTDVYRGVKKGEKAFIDSFIINRQLLVDIIEGYKAVSYSDLFDCLKGSYGQFNVRTFEFEGYGKSIFDIDSYFDGNMDSLVYEVDKALFSSERPILTKEQDSVPTKYGRNCEVRNATIPAGCKISGRVEKSVLFRHVIVEEGATVKNSIIMQDCVIKAGAHVENAIIDRGNTIDCNMVIKGTEEKKMIIPKKNI